MFVHATLIWTNDLKTGFLYCFKKNGTLNATLRADPPYTQNTQAA